MPLQRWFCDGCGGDIVDPSMALVVERHVKQHDSGDWMIVHKGDCDPKAKGGYLHNVELSHYLGDDGLAVLQAELSNGPLIGGDRSDAPPLTEFVDLFRRVQAPWYEEARRRFNDSRVQSDYSDSNEIWPYLPKSLEKIATEYED